MAKNITESIFNVKTNMHDLYPVLSDVKYFDLQKKHLFYGRLDRHGDAVYLNHMKLKEINGGRKKTHFAASFVADAFRDMRMNIQKAAGAIDNNSLYRPSMKVHKSWTHGDLEYNYNMYINKIYTNFVNSFLSIDRRHEKITNFRSFIREFMRYIIRVARQFPITKTGYILSNHCSPFISGLMIEINAEKHGTQNNSNVIKYINDPNYKNGFIVNQVRKFGFMVDKNAPWRFVFNIMSGAAENGTPIAGQKYLQQNGVNHENVFDFFYRKAHLEELINVRNLFYSLYDAFYTQFSTYETQKFITSAPASGLRSPPSGPSRCTRVKIISERAQRDPPGPVMETDELADKYWLKAVLKLRMLEADVTHDAQNFIFYIKKMLSQHSLFGVDGALNYINDLTKGFEETKFITKGSYWSGLSEREYFIKKLGAASRRYETAQTGYEITGTKNIIK